jgi:hypothetical protein
VNLCITQFTSPDLVGYVGEDFWVPLESALPRLTTCSDREIPVAGSYSQPCKGVDETSIARAVAPASEFATGMKTLLAGYICLPRRQHR